MSHLVVFFIRFCGVFSDPRHNKSDRIHNARYSCIFYKILCVGRLEGIYNARYSCIFYKILCVGGLEGIHNAKYSCIF